MENIVKAGPNTIKAHLNHLKSHGQTKYYNQAIAYLKLNKIDIPNLETPALHACPSAIAKTITPNTDNAQKAVNTVNRLQNWPVQLHLLNANAPYLQDSNLLIAADCAPFAFANFHEKFIKDKIVINFCPKLDKNLNSYIDKLADIFSTKNIKTVSIVRMEVPCCGGIEKIVEEALKKAKMFKMVKISVI